MKAEHGLKAAIIAVIAMSLMLVSGVAEALVPTPRIKPPAPNASQFLNDEDAKRFRKGLRAAKKGRWGDVNHEIKKIDDPTAKDVLRWIRAARDPNVAFKDISYVVQDLPTWPRMNCQWKALKNGSN